MLNLRWHESYPLWNGFGVIAYVTDVFFSLCFRTGEAELKLTAGSINRC